MWPFRPRSPRRTMQAQVEWRDDGVAVIDVRGQTCPGYLLAINRVVETLPPDTLAELLISYPPCGSDVQAWCRERGIRFLEFSPVEDHWRIRIQK